MEANNVYSQPKLPYDVDALEPAISRSTVEYHYGKHEKAYIDNLNRLIKDTRYADMAIEDIIRESDGALFNNASQAWNIYSTSSPLPPMAVASLKETCAKPLSAILVPLSSSRKIS